MLLARFRLYGDLRDKDMTIKQTKSYSYKISKDYFV